MIALAILATVILVGAVVAGIVTGWREDDIVLGICVGLLATVVAVLLVGAGWGAWALWTEALS